MMCGEEGVTFPLTFILAFFLPRDTQSHILTHTHTHLRNCVAQACAGARVTTQMRNWHLSIHFSSLASLLLFPMQVPLQPGQSFKFTVLETLDRIKEEFQFLQAQYHRYTDNITIRSHKCGAEECFYSLDSPHFPVHLNDIN